MLQTIDFRPCPSSISGQRGAGAYLKYSKTDTNHWIPGAKDRMKATSPSPRDGAVGVHIDADLIFLGVYRATGHTVYYSEKSEKHIRVAEHLKGGESNIAHLPVASLRENTEYMWMVSSVLNGEEVNGTIWKFTTGNTESCS